MRRCLLALALPLFIGCGMPHTNVVDDERNSRPGAAVTAEFESAQNGTEWLMDTKHTIKGLSLEAGNEMMKRFLDLGASDIRFGDIAPDPLDASYASAASLIIALPGDSAKRKAVLDEIQNRDPQEMPREDIGQTHVKMRIRPSGG